jgi:DNA end-binding protein Ku
LDIPKGGHTGVKEVDMAITLIKQLTHKFTPKEYKDTYIEDLKKIIEQKAKGRKVKPKGKAPKATSSKNLMTLLKSSIKKKAA